MTDYFGDEHPFDNSNPLTNAVAASAQEREPTSSPPLETFPQEPPTQEMTDAHNALVDYTDVRVEGWARVAQVLGRLRGPKLF